METNLNVLWVAVIIYAALILNNLGVKLFGNYVTKKEWAIMLALGAALSYVAAAVIANIGQ
jgi:hypothetical protein